MRSKQASFCHAGCTNDIQGLGLNPDELQEVEIEGTKLPSGFV
jgi:hypothetical protein